MIKIKLNIRSLVYSQMQLETYILVLVEENGERKLPIVIGIYEAQAIAVALEAMKPTRPLTHDLFVTFSAAHNIKITEVQITSFEEGIFHSELICESPNNKIRIDARTSDAIALAVRFKCPIYIDDAILETTGITTNDFDDFDDLDDLDDDFSDELEADDLKAYSISELQEILGDAIKDEDYELASKIRDEINRRKQDNG